MMFIKKVFVWAICVMALASCGIEKKDVSNNTDSETGVAVSDLKNVESVSDKALSSPLLPFESSDFRRYDLRGKVKQVAVFTLGCDASGNLKGDTLLTNKTFFIDGNVFDNDKNVKYIRNGKGELTRFEMKLPDYGITVSTDYTYDGNGMLVQEDIRGLDGTCKRFYTYDANLDCTTGGEKSFGEGVVFESAKTYEVKERDNNTNWTKRLVKMVNREGLDDGSGKWNTIETSYLMEVREIKYAE